MEPYHRGMGSLAACHPTSWPRLASRPAAALLTAAMNRPTLRRPCNGGTPGGHGGDGLCAATEAQTRPILSVGGAPCKEVEHVRL